MLIWDTQPSPFRPRYGLRVLTASSTAPAASLRWPRPAPLVAGEHSSPSGHRQKHPVIYPGCQSDNQLYLAQSQPMLFPAGATKARPSGSQSPAALLCAQTDGRITPCRSALRKTRVGVKPYRHWDSPAYLSRWQAARAPQRTKRRRIRRRPQRVTNSFLVRRNSPTLAWRRSMSSTRKMPEHPRSPNS